MSALYQVAHLPRFPRAWLRGIIFPMSAIWIVTLAAFGILAAYAILCFYLFRVGFGRMSLKKLRILERDPSVPEPYRQILALNAEWWQGAAPVRMEAVSDDGLTLVADFIPAREKNRPVVLLLHGHSGGKESMASYGRLFLRLGDFNLLAPDLRAHGQSQGSYVSYGLRERLDVEAWLGRIAQSLGPETKVILMGVSMGAATALMSAAGLSRPEPKGLAGGLQANALRFVVADCPYSDAWSIFSHKLRQLSSLPAAVFLAGIWFFCKVFAGFSLFEASPQRSVGNIAVPVLFIHGECDDFVPISMGRALYQAVHTPKGFLAVEGARHTESHLLTPEAYVQALDGFVKAYL